MKRPTRARMLLLSFVLVQFMLIAGAGTALASSCDIAALAALDLGFEPPAGKSVTWYRSHILEACAKSRGVLPVTTMLAGGAGAAVAIGLGRKEEEEEEEEEPERSRRPGPRPNLKKPRDYDGRENVWDPSIEEQERMWDERGTVWDPETLSWKEPKAEDFPPPEQEVNTPFTENLPRSEVPWECLGLYDQYTLAQRDALELQERIKVATEEYEFAVDEYGKQYLKAILKLGYDTASLAAAGGDAAAGAGRALRGRVPTPRDLWLGPYDKLQAMLRQASQAVSAAAERLAALARIAAEAAAEAVSRSKVIQAIKEGLETARSKIAQLRGTADAAQAKVVNLEAKEAAAKQLNVLKARDQQLSYDLMSLEQQYKQLDDYIEKARSFEQAYAQWTAANAALGLKKDRLRDVMGDILRLQKMAHNDPERYAAMIAKLEAEAAQLSAFVAEAEKTAMTMQDWMAAHGHKELYESLANHPVARGQTVGSMESLQALQQERTRLGTRLMKEQSEAAKLQAEIASLSGTLGGATTETIGAELQQTRKGLNETLDAIGDQEQLVSRLDGDLPQAGMELRTAERAKEQADEAVKQAQEAIRRAEEQVRDAETKLAALGPPPAANALMTPGMMAQIAKAWVWAFGADQSGAEMGNVLLQLQQAVSERKSRIEQAESEYKAKIQEMKDAKPKLDACLREHARPDEEPNEE
ncbi:MAG: hypothetical protein HYY09_00015 [Firmicutes bacterium]|nr:hypothetical protein [Bacillota bacterium]